MDKEIIVDTSALIAFFVKSETHHEIAQKYCHVSDSDDLAIWEAFC